MCILYLFSSICYSDKFVIDQTKQKINTPILFEIWKQAIINVEKSKIKFNKVLDQNTFIKRGIRIKTNLIIVILLFGF